MSDLLSSSLGIALFIFATALFLLQVAAATEGIEIAFGIKGAWLYLIACFLVFFVIVARPLNFLVTGLAIYGAYKGWHWPVWQIALFILPMFLLSLGLLFFSAIREFVASKR